MHGNIFISGQWGFDVDLACKTLRNEQQRFRLSLYWHNRSLPNCPHYWPVISFIRPVPSGPNLGLPPPACGVCEEHKTRCVYLLSAGQQNIAAHLHHWLRVLVFSFHSAQIKWTVEGEGGGWVFCYPAGEWDVKTLIHLGFRTTVSNYSHGSLVKAVVFQSRRETTFCCNYARSTWIIFPVWFGSH